MASMRKAAISYQEMAASQEESQRSERSDRIEEGFFIFRQSGPIEIKFEENPQNFDFRHRPNAS